MSDTQSADLSLAGPMKDRESVMAHLLPGLELRTGVRLLAVFVTGLGLVVWASARSAPWRSMLHAKRTLKKGRTHESIAHQKSM